MTHRHGRDVVQANLLERCPVGQKFHEGRELSRWLASLGGAVGAAAAGAREGRRVILRAMT